MAPKHMHRGSPTAAWISLSQGGNQQAWYVRLDDGIVPPWIFHQIDGVARCISLLKASQNLRQLAACDTQCTSHDIHLAWRPTAGASCASSILIRPWQVLAPMPKLTLLPCTVLIPSTSHIMRTTPGLLVANYGELLSLDFEAAAPHSIPAMSEYFSAMLYQVPPNRLHAGSETSFLARLACHGFDFCCLATILARYSRVRLSGWQARPTICWTNYVSCVAITQIAR
jgi:hypothetical protein